MASRDLRWVHGPTAAVAYWRWRDALFEGPFRQRLGRTEFAEPSRDRALQFIHRLSRTAPIHLRHYFAEPSCGMALRFTHRLSRGHHPPLPSVLVVWPSRSSEQETPSSLSRVFHPSLEQRLPSTYTPIRSPPISHPSCAHSMVTHRMQADRCMSFGRLSVHRFGNGVLPPDEQPA